MIIKVLSQAAKFKYCFVSTQGGYLDSLKRANILI